MFVGRFQPFHLGHYKVVKRLLKDYEEVIILIGSSEADFVYDWNNPMSVGERIEPYLGLKQFIRIIRL
ncbi:adenylyltransferase/cytidyltransferase family protein [Candidatus Micrarchaeota archaeon]|nr:adenylyltransferase/cytidyltransferase family protein [Candidatus Micrarchaeota archaeon]